MRLKNPRGKAPRKHAWKKYWSYLCQRIFANECRVGTGHLAYWSRTNICDTSTTLWSMHIVKKISSWNTNPMVSRDVSHWHILSTETFRQESTVSYYINTAIRHFNCITKYLTLQFLTICLLDVARWSTPVKQYNRENYTLMNDRRKQ